ncbi:MAG: hypothetical protein AB9873_14335 [Syntrophobacteraceae bacterium]
MNIKTRLRLMTALSAFLVCIMTLLLFWAHHRVTEAVSAQHLANEIVGSIVERTTLRGDYMRNENARARDQWLTKHNHIRELTTEARSVLGSAGDLKTLNDMSDHLEASGVIFSQIVENRELARRGSGDALRTSELEKRLGGLLILKSHDTVSGARRLKETTGATMRRAA